MTTTRTDIQTRSIARVVAGTRTLEGGGFSVRRPFPTRTLDHFDPFLLLDEMGPTSYAAGAAKGAPDHPHRGFETVTYLLAGGMEHRDSAGHAGRLTRGDVQWMTAGAGVVHSEMPEKEFLKTGGLMHGFQIWVNLPKKDKMMRPRYQEIPSARVPVATSPDGKASVRVIAGESYGAKAVIDTRTPIALLHFTLQAGASVAQAVPRDWNAFALVFEGSATFGEKAVRASDGDAVFFAGDGDEISFTAGENGAQVLFLAGLPLNETVARYGPFVMNTRSELIQAVEDFEAGRLGSIPAEIA
jgi:redox-sensitive bicupin YhaK (pirin superfamily)